MAAAALEELAERASQPSPHRASSAGIETGHVVTGAIILVSQPAGVSGAIAISAREHAG